MASTNYTLGRGKVYFDRFVPGTTTKTGERYLGNTTEFNLTVTTESLDHFDSDQGLRVKDQTVLLEVSRAGSIVTDEISTENLALFFLAEAATITEAGGAVTDETATVQQGMYYQLGANDTAPAGVRDVSAVTVCAAAVGASPYTLADDYTVDAELGRIYIVPGGAITDDSTVYFNYTVDASTREQIVTADTTIEGALRYVAYNAQGTKRDYYLPYTKMSPSGDFSLKGEDWLQLTFDVEVLKLSDTVEAIYIDGRPA
jgi:hypothetical protein